MLDQLHTDNSRVYISKKVFLILCPEGERLYNHWIQSINMHASPDVIYKAMQAYFTHRNGVLTKNFSKKHLNYCRECSSWMQERDV